MSGGGAAGPVSIAGPAGAPVGPEAVAGVGMEGVRQAYDTDLADDSWTADSAELAPAAEGPAAEDLVPATDAAAVAALAVGLGGCAGAHRAGPGPRTRRGFRT